MYLKDVCSHAHVERSKAHKLQSEPLLNTDLMQSMHVVLSFLQHAAHFYKIWQMAIMVLLATTSDSKASRILNLLLKTL